MTHQKNKLIEYKLCPFCKLKFQKSKLGFCETCKFSKLNTKFLEYRFKGAGNNKPIKDKLSTNFGNNLDFIYYSSPSLKSNIITKYCKFKDIEHLTSYILYSNEVPYSQLVFSLGINPKKFNQFSILLGACNIDNIVSNLTVTKDNNNDLSILYSPKFWQELIYLYLVNFHPFNSLFNLKYFNHATISPTLLMAIYHKGYQYYSKKFTKLTDYMNQLASSLLKKILFKSSFDNLQAIYLLIYSLNIGDETEVGRAYISQLTRMGYSLGLDINTNRFTKQLNYDRKLTFLRVCNINRNVSGSINVYPNYIMELPIYDPSLYKSELQSLPSSYKFNQAYDNTYYSKLTTINSKFRDLTLYQVTFPKSKFNSSNKLKNFCLNRQSELNKILLDANRDFELLKFEYYDKLEDIQVEEVITSQMYLKFSLDVIEYWKLNSISLTQVLISNLIQLTTELIEQNRKIGKLHTYSFLIAFNYLSVYKSSTNEQKSQINKNLNLLRQEIGKFNKEGNLMNKLIIQTGLKLIKISD